MFKGAFNYEIYSEAVFYLMKKKIMIIILRKRKFDFLKT